VSRLRVHLTGYDRFGWAFDENLRLTALAIEGFADVVSLEECDVVHATWWEAVRALPAYRLDGRRVLTYTSDDIYVRILTDPNHAAARRLIACWLARTQGEMRQLDVVGVRHVYVPRIVDVATFRPLEPKGPEVRALREAWGIPADRYLIANFQRDTELHDLRSPKLQKGPDVFAEIVWQLHRRGLPIHVVLAGPRRAWIRRQLTELGVPFTYVGTDVDGDDITVNRQPRAALNVLYNLVDLCLIPSRHEGGPHAALEAAAAGCKVVATPVGHVPDVLEPASIVRSLSEAVRVIEDDVRSRSLDATLAPQARRLADVFSVKAVAARLETVYAEARDLPAVRAASGPAARLAAQGARVGRFVDRVVRRSRGAGAGLVVSLWNAFYAPPYGGANQFMRALGVALAARGARVLENAAYGADVHILQGNWFDIPRFRRHVPRGTPVIHRIDGPVHLYRGFGREKDEEVFALNAEYAHASVLQSAWSFERTVEMGYRPINPVLIGNAPDPRIFNRDGAAVHDGRRKLRLISTSWSDNPRKGAPLYAYLDRHLDWSRFEYTFVGRIATSFQHIRVIPAVPSAALADHLRAHDVYVTASQSDPCSNALAEALACGLPALYLADGGHPELVGPGGVPFTGQGDVLAALDQLVAHHASYRRLVRPLTMDEVVERYLTLIHEVLRGDWVATPPLDVAAVPAEA